MQKTPQIILGIDPGTQVMGYSIIAVSGRQIRLVEMSILKLDNRKTGYEKLRLIHEKVSAIIQQHQPLHCAIEAPFFGKNVQSMLKLGRAQGVAIAAAMQAGIEVFEYSPKKIKQSITGNGNAGKEQVWKMLQSMLSIQAENLRYLDASDALAVALCHHFQDAALPAVKGNRAGDWNEFLRKHPDRIVAP